MRLHQLSTVIAALTSFAALAHAELSDVPLAETECSAAPGHAARIAPIGDIRGVRDFDFAELTLAYAAHPSIVIEGAPAAIINVRVRVEDGIAFFERAGCTQSEWPIRITVSAPNFDEISVRGGSKVTTSGTIRTQQGATIELEGAVGADIAIRSAAEVVFFADGSASHRLRVEAGSLIAFHSGSGELLLSGRAERASLAQLGRGTIASRGLQSGHILAEIGGAGAITALR